MDLTARAAGLGWPALGRDRAPPHDRGDLLEGDREHVVQHEREALVGCQGVQDDQERRADGVGELDLLLGRGRGHRLGGRVGPHLPPGGAGAQHVQADAGDHRGQPSAQILDGLGV